MAGEGWHSSRSGQPIDSDAVGWMVGGLHRRLELLGLREGRLGMADDRLTPTGRCAALTALYARAVRPRESPLSG